MYPLFLLVFVPLLIPLITSEDVSNIMPQTIVEVETNEHQPFRRNESQRAQEEFKIAEHQTIHPSVKVVNFTSNKRSHISDFTDPETGYNHFVDLVEGTSSSTSRTVHAKLPITRSSSKPINQERSLNDSEKIVNRHRNTTDEAMEFSPNMSVWRGSFPQHPSQQNVVPGYRKQEENMKDKRFQDKVSIDRINRISRGKWPGDIPVSPQGRYPNNPWLREPIEDTSVSVRLGHILDPLEPVEGESTSRRQMFLETVLDHPNEKGRLFRDPVDYSELPDLYPSEKSFFEQGNQPTTISDELFNSDPSINSSDYDVNHEDSIEENNYQPTPAYKDTKPSKEVVKNDSGSNITVLVSVIVLVASFILLFIICLRIRRINKIQCCSRITEDVEACKVTEPSDESQMSQTKLSIRKIYIQ